VVEVATVSYVTYNPYKTLPTSYKLRPGTLGVWKSTVFKNSSLLFIVISVDERELKILTSRGYKTFDIFTVDNYMVFNNGVLSVI
jgi:hypothetical protein